MAAAAAASPGRVPALPEHASWVSGQARAQYSNKLELMLSLVGYAVGFGNIWRFPYLVYAHGGGAFLVPYALSLLFLGLPLFILEMGLGQMFRQSALGVWNKMDLPRLRGVGAAATLCTFFITLYYNVIMAWTIYFLGRTFGAAFSRSGLPWGDLGEQCPESLLIVRREAAQSPWIIDSRTGLFNVSHASDFWCPLSGLPRSASQVPDGFVAVFSRPSSCPGEAAVRFWQQEVLQQSSGMDELGGIHWGMFIAFTVAWLLVYLTIVNGIKTSGKVVYVTATLPYVALFAFLVRALTLDNASLGIQFLVAPDFSELARPYVWGRAATQIFYSLGVGFGTLIAFASYGERHSDYARDAVTAHLSSPASWCSQCSATWPMSCRGSILALRATASAACRTSDCRGRA
mmetsp:Transcript_67028/g.216701  ORF Transcript_67028/g.216701 Transcript_67028/m.216701 type:complete len:403 (+) Transcript_67028:1-1209(+)